MYLNFGVILFIVLNCALIKHGATLSSGSMTNFWKKISTFVCQSEMKCTECLDDILNDVTISEEEVSSKMFLRLQECKSMVPRTFQKYLESLKNKFKLAEKIPMACFQKLEGQKSIENYNVDFRRYAIDDYVRSKNTFFLEELLKFGLGTVLYYMNENQGTTEITEGVCDTIVPSYIEAALSAGSLLRKDREFETQNMDHDSLLEYIRISNESSSKPGWYNPYGRFVHTLCGEDDHCRACNLKVTDIFKIRIPDKNSDFDIQVMKYCRKFLKWEFKQFSEKLQEPSFNSCMKFEGAYDILFKGHDTMGNLDIKKAEAKQEFSNFKPFLDFLFDGVCYIYREKDAVQPDLTVVNNFKRKKIPRAYKNILEI